MKKANALNGDKIKMEKFIKNYESEWTTIKERPDLIGKKAMFKANHPKLSWRLYNKTGIIKQLHQIKKGDLDHVGMSLVFDKPLNEHNGWKMNSCYIHTDTIELI